MRTSNKKQLQDMVCYMMVDEHSYSMKYQGHDYAFCSQQCRERFESNPHLYIGRPGQSSPKQQGREIIKKRTLKLNKTLTENQSIMIVNELVNMMGIKNIVVESDHIIITYDLLQSTVEQIESKLENSGEKLGHNLATELKQAFIHYLEEAELDNLEQQ